MSQESTDARHKVAADLLSRFPDLHVPPDATAEDLVNILVERSGRDKGSADALCCEIGKVLHALAGAQEQLEESNRLREELKISNRDLEQFAAVASHDMKEPLRSIGAFAELFVTKYSGQLDERAHKWLGFMSTGVARIETLIDDMLVYSRVGTQALDLEYFSPKEAVDNVLADLEEKFKGSSAVMFVGALPYEIRAHKSMFYRVIQNLVSNAVKFSLGDPRVFVRGDTSATHWNFSVADNGIGISPRFHARIFEATARLQSKDEYEGSGMGLSIVRRVVERHGGEVRIESEEGDGATIHFSIAKRAH